MKEKFKYKIPQHCVVYTGTHDNATLKQWYEELDDKERMKEIYEGSRIYRRKSCGRYACIYT